MPTLEFKVSGQHIERVDNVQPVAKSREYIVAHFEFLSPEWEGIKTAIFSSSNGAIRQPLDDNGNCVVPWEFWDADRDLTGYVSVFCGDLVTADRAPVRMYQSGYQETDESREPTPDEYQQMVERVEAITKECNELLTKLGKKVDSQATEIAKKANIADPVFTGSMSMGRKAGSAVGESSATLGEDNIAGCKGYKIKEIYIGPESVYTDRNLAAVRFGENSPTNWKAGDLLSFDGDYHLYNRFEIIEVIDTSSYYAIGIKDNAGLEFKYRSVIDRTLTDINFVGGYFSNINCLDEGDTIPEKGCQFASGEDNKSIGRGAFTSGRNNIADGDGGAATGRDNEVGYCGFASGRGNKVNGEYATGIGHYNNVPGDIAFASGRGNEANGYCASVGGKGNKANGDYASADGAGNVADGKFAKVWGSDGNKATHAGATAWGYGNQAINDRATTWGVRNISSGNRATTWGRDNEASADNATSFGEATKATKKDATSFGRHTQANGECALSTGAYTTANANCQFVHGRFNIPDTENKYAHIVGNGADLKHLRNIYTLDWNGNAWFAGTAEATAIILKSSTAGSTKRFKITVDDSGTLKATEIISFGPFF